MSRISLCAVVLVLAVSLMSCGRPTHQYTDNEDVTIESISHVRDGEFLVVSAKLVNDDDEDITHSVYRMLWFDANGALLEQSAWRPLIVKGGAPVYIRERSTVPGATEYTLLISNDASY